MQEGLTQEELAKAVGTTQKNISDLENGQQGSSSFVLAISDHLGIPPPFIPIADELELQWMRAGQALLVADRGLFLIKLQEVQLLLGHIAPKA